MIRHQMTLTADTAATPVSIGCLLVDGQWFMYEGCPHMYLGYGSDERHCRALKFDPGTGKPKGEVELPHWWVAIPLSHHITLEPAEYP